MLDAAVVLFCFLFVLRSLSDSGVSARMGGEVVANGKPFWEFQPTDLQRFNTNTGFVL